MVLTLLLVESVRIVVHLHACMQHSVSSPDQHGTLRFAQALLDLLGSYHVVACAAFDRNCHKHIQIRRELS